MWTQRTLTLDPRPRGFHLITDAVRDALDLSNVAVGVLHVFIQHTSAALTINENASPAVRGDLERHFNEMVPEGQPYYEHTLEGPDDMPAHIKASMLSHTLTVPINNGTLQLGTWQGLYLCEHRTQGGPRTLVLTVHGQAPEAA
ncbi:secondary thiamine-phosphate synthase enzyme YjbQ [Salisaeta longa]|uniref:secondary thiamine-phosphate synthase enzyme YjbQ n=1 Tax=Salisaeta longa TaxID=503170 RepID=UPI0003B7303E|nr:secondary thiamine-phosphate synthase enzyme YjbQ [Salisaeta longa]